jgi:hypothetical protein
MRSLYFLIPVLALSAYKAHADEAKCLSKIIYAESRGESITGAVATAQATINRAGNQDTSICKVTGVNRRQPDKSLADYYLAIARTALFDKFPAVVSKADSWNTGTKPRQHGDVERVIDNHVFYVATPIAEKR